LTLFFFLEKRFSLDRDTIQKLAQHCNVKKEAAIDARQQSGMMFLTKHMNKLSQLQRQAGSEALMFREAIIVAVFDQYFDVIIPELNLEKRVHLACLPVWRSDYNPHKQSLTMFWRKGVYTSTGEKGAWSLSDEEDMDEIDEEVLLEEMHRSHPSSPQQEEEEDYKLKRYEHDTIVSQLAIDIAPPKSVSTPVVMTPRPETTRSSNRRASIVRARLSDSTAFSTEQGYQTIRALDKIRVVLVNELQKTPPVIRVLAANPFS
jgi:protein SSD1